MSMKTIAKVMFLIASIFLTQCNLFVQDNSPCDRIAYTYYAVSDSQEGDIYSICSNGSDPQQLTYDPAFDGQPAWSPDGESIAFTSMRSGESHIYVIDADGMHPVQLTTDLQNDLPVWLPDGKQIAFRTTDGQGLWWWRNINLDTNDISQLTEPSYDFFFQKQIWSPDGKEIAYMSLVEQSARNDGSSQIHIRQVDGSADRVITDNLWANINPVWSPDGERLAFLSEMHGEYNVFALYVIGADGSNLYQISEPIYSEQAVYSWSPDGEQIVISDAFVGQAGRVGIRILDIASGKSRQLISLEEWESALYPAWQLKVDSQ